MHKWFRFFYLILPATTAVWASETSLVTDLQTQNHVSRSRLILGLAGVQLITEDQNFDGVGMIFSYQYALTSSFAVTPEVGQVYGISTGTKSLYTSLGAAIEYAVTGSYIYGSTEYSSKGLSVIKLLSPQISVLSLGLGFEQLFLSGSQSTYSAPGFVAGIGYSSEIFERFYRLQFKYGQYKNNEEPVTGIALNVSTYFDF